jgi:cytochrome c oxidase subunit 2
MSGMNYQCSLLCLFAACCLAVASSSRAQDEPLIPPEEFVYCTVCHGVQMKGNPDIEAPRLSGMDADYVERQLRSFKKGWRGTHENDIAGMEMRPMAAILTDKEIAAAARYVNTVSSEPPPATVEGDADRGKLLYASCVACHGNNAEGVEALRGPSLTGLNDWYLATQLSNFWTGTRGSHPDDTYGAQMRAAAVLLPDESSIQDVVSYINNLQSR